MKRKIEWNQINIAQKTLIASIRYLKPVNIEEEIRRHQTIHQPITYSKIRLRYRNTMNPCPFKAIKNVNKSIKIQKNGVEF